MHPHFDAANESNEPTGSTDPNDVIIRCNDNPAIRIRLRDAVNPDDEVAVRFTASRLVHYTVEIHAPEMAAQLDRVVGWVGETREIDGFLTDLARDFGGWDGERRWHTDDRDLTVTAAFRSGGRVELTWELRPRRLGGCGWAASVTLVVETGEQLAALAGDVRRFLSRADG
ncbi:DUF6228 family protein [Embleya sp. NPDC005971]|uniref:DUF6228 family protein n=1 Tax=Embleya sp. NPDC005971 TaxID=3156724 RepID=UPI0033ED8EC4